MSSLKQEEAIIEHLKEVLSAECLHDSKMVRERRIFIHVHRNCLIDTITLIHSQGFTHLSTITGLEIEDSIELIYHLIRNGTQIGVRTHLPLDDPQIPTITKLIPGASLYEREVHDILGVKFEGHPNLAKLILPDMWDQSLPPLRKQKSTEQAPIDIRPRKSRRSQSDKRDKKR